ncbi:MAG: sel1 repeat family protein [Thermoguttaceae bacterium]|nr:sel1 repeat family protein [Thermoguttaceae bacterium]
MTRFSKIFALTIALLFVAVLTSCSPNADKTSESQKAKELFDQAFTIMVNSKPSEQSVEDQKKVFDLMQQSAELGNAEAYVYMADFYLRGKGVEKDSTKAIELLKKAADMDCPGGYAMLAKCYEDGEVVEKNVTEAERCRAKAFELLKKEAEHGDVEAQINLGFIYTEGNGVDKDLGEAEKWFRKAAEQGYEPAKEVLKQLGKWNED